MRIHHRQISIGSRQAEGFALHRGTMPAADHPARLSDPLRNPLEALMALEEWRILESYQPGEEPRWPAEAMPLGVHIQPDRDMPGAEQMLFETMRQWEGASLGRVRFVQCLADARIRVLWSDSTVPGRDCEVGHTDLQTTSAGIIRGATITLIREPLIDAALAPERRRNRLIATMLHETGHALGLRHSPSARDVMHHRGWQRPFLSGHDIQRIQRLYQQKHITLG